MKTVTTIALSSSIVIILLIIAFILLYFRWSCNDTTDGIYQCKRQFLGTYATKSKCNQRCTVKRIVDELEI